MKKKDAVDQLSVYVHICILCLNKICSHCNERNTDDGTVLTQPRCLHTLKYRSQTRFSFDLHFAPYVFLMLLQNKYIKNSLFWMYVASWCSASCCSVQCVCFCTIHFVTVSLNLTCLHCVYNILSLNISLIYFIFYIKLHAICKIQTHIQKSHSIC